MRRYIDRTMTRSIVSSMEDFCHQHVLDGVTIDFTKDMLAGNGDSDFSNSNRRARIGVLCRSGLFGASVQDVVSICVAAGHELCHFEQCGLAKGFNEVRRDVCISHIACRHNHAWYGFCGKKNHLCEIDAEGFGYVYALFVLERFVGQDEAGHILVDYCNEHIQHPSEYYLCGEDCRTFPLRTMDDLSDAFDNAMERCRQSCHTYPVRDDTPFGDEFFDVMRRGRAMKEDCFDKFVHLNRKYMPAGLPTLRDGMACLSLYLHPEYADEYPADLSGLSAEAVFGSPFQETPERMLRYMEYVREHEVPVRNGGSPLTIPEPWRIASVPSAGRESVSVPIGGDIGKNHDGPDGPG